jgi:hypothetical protein
MAEIVPFPAVRRVGLIRNMARLLATYSADAAEHTLHARLDATREAMLRRGLAHEVAAREARSLELAIRTRLRVVVAQGGDVA